MKKLFKVDGNYVLRHMKLIPKFTAIAGLSVNIKESKQPIIFYIIKITIPFLGLY